MHPGWTAYVDGISKTIFRANGDQRAVLIPAGPPGASHSVDFRYAPADFLVGLYVTLAATATTLFILIGVKDRQITAGR